MTKPLVGIATSGTILTEADPSRSLDLLINDGGVNAVFLATQAGVGPSAAGAHARFYGNTLLRPSDAGEDELAALLATATDRGLAVYSWLSETPEHGLVTLRAGLGRRLADRRLRPPDAGPVLPQP